MADSKPANPLHILGPCLGLNQLCFASMLPLRPEFLFQIMNGDMVRVSSAVARLTSVGALSEFAINPMFGRLSDT